MADTHIEVRYDDEGRIDEIVGRNVDVHWEMLSDTGAMLILSKDVGHTTEEYAHFDVFHKGRARLTVQQQG